MSDEWSSWVERITAAQARVYRLAQVTPVSTVSWSTGPEHLLIKREDLQTTGSFKVRGATNKVLSLTPECAAKGVVTSSTGNHGLGVAAAAQFRGIEAEVVVSRQVSPEKVENIGHYGATIRFAGNTPLEAELAARAAAQASGRVYISPYNDVEVIAGQGTIAVELVAQVPVMDTIYVAVGGGGLLGGIGAYLKAVSPKTEVVGCWPRNSRVMYECLQAGRIIEVPEQATFSESTAGAVEPGSLTFELCRQVIDRAVLVSEEEILQAMHWARGRAGTLWQSSGNFADNCRGSKLSSRPPANQARINNAPNCQHLFWTAESEGCGGALLVYNCVSGAQETIAPRNRMR
jgi:threonine dehydratase